MRMRPVRDAKRERVARAIRIVDLAILGGIPGVGWRSFVALVIARAREADPRRRASLS